MIDMDEETAKHLCSKYVIVKIQLKKKEVEAVKCLGHTNGGCSLSPSFHGDPADERKFNVAANISNISADLLNSNFVYDSLDCCKNHKQDGDMYVCKGHLLTFHGDPLRDPLHMPIEEGMIKLRQILHGPIFFVYPPQYFPPYLGKWEFNKEADKVCSHYQSVSHKIDQELSMSGCFENNEMI